MTSTTSDPLRAEVERLGPWFHNLHLPNGVQTAPDHALGDFPLRKWVEVEPLVPPDLSGWRVLDIGCNAGFYALELARRGAHVTAIDVDPRYLAQARWAAELFGLTASIELRRMQVYDLARPDVAARWGRFDLVLFMGVLYHLRHPLLALEIVRERVGGLMLFQTLELPFVAPLAIPEDVTLDDRELLTRAGWPRMAFVERNLAADPTNWWVPDPSCTQALLRAAGFTVVERPSLETYLCRPGPSPYPDDLARVVRAELLSASGRASEPREDSR